jgi:hypothetical protein
MSFRSFWLLTVGCNSLPQAEEIFRLVARALNAVSVEPSYTAVPAKAGRRPHFEIRFVLDHAEQDRDVVLGQLLGRCQQLSRGWQVYFTSGSRMHAETNRVKDVKRPVAACWFLESGDTVLFPSNIAARTAVSDSAL